MRVEVLYVADCPGAARLLPRLDELIARAGVAAEVELRRIASPEQAQAERFLGSPTVRVDGRDIEPGAGERTDFGLKCRLYRTPDGVQPAPPDECVAAALGADPGRPPRPVW